LFGLLLVGRIYGRAIVHKRTSTLRVTETMLQPLIAIIKRFFVHTDFQVLFDQQKNPCRPESATIRPIVCLVGSIAANGTNGPSTNRGTIVRQSFPTLPRVSAEALATVVSSRCNSRGRIGSYREPRRRPAVIVRLPSSCL